jgi:hypothetical protein
MGPGHVYNDMVLTMPSPNQLSQATKDFTRYCRFARLDSSLTTVSKSSHIYPTPRYELSIL